MIIHCRKRWSPCSARISWISRPSPAHGPPIVRESLSGKQLRYAANTSTRAWRFSAVSALHQYNSSRSVPSTLGRKWQPPIQKQHGWLAARNLWTIHVGLVSLDVFDCFLLESSALGSRISTFLLQPGEVPPSVTDGNREPGRPPHHCKVPPVGHRERAPPGPPSYGTASSGITVDLEEGEPRISTLSVV